jgi:hypothetical protein
MCGRTEKEFTDHFNPTTYDQEISKLEAEIAQYLKNISTEIKTSLKKTEKYEGSISIAELIDNQKVYAKFMPDWELLLMRISPRNVHSDYGARADGGWGPGPEYPHFDNKWRNYTVESIRKVLSDAAEELDKGKHPSESYMINESILQNEKKLKVLKMKRDQLLDLIANPGFVTYETVLRRAKDSDEKIDETINVKFKLCPVCSNLHAEYMASLVHDDGGWDDWE